MTNVNDIMDKVDKDLLNLIEAGESFRTYRTLSKSAPTTSNAFVASGTLGIEIDSRKPIGISISLRG